MDEDILAHFGVKGMKWGVRKDRPDGVSRRTDREARKDAQEAARAKMFFGQGAGTRRKLINKSVEAKKQRSESYSKAFDHHIKNQDLSKHADKAKSERKRKDVTTKNKQRLGAIARSRTGEMGTQAAFVAVAASGYAYLNSPRGRATMSRTAGQATRMASNFASRARRSGLNDNLTEFFRANGVL